jgi:hypothetical protein
MDAGLTSFTEHKRKEPININTELEQPQSATVRSVESDSSSLLSKEKTQKDVETRDTRITGTVEPAATKPFSFLKPR